MSLSICLFLANHLLGCAVLNGYMMRGSIVYGELSYNENFTFGKSITEAYELESGHSEPSIVMSKSLKKQYEDKYLYQNDIMSPFSTYYNDDRRGAKRYFEGIYKMVNRLNYLSIVDERTVAKYDWLINEFNRYFSKCANIHFIKSPSHYEVQFFVLK